MFIRSISTTLRKYPCKYLAMKSSRPVGYSHQKIFKANREIVYNTINAVDDYHTFLPWCSSSHISYMAPDQRFYEAELEINFKIYKDKYMSKVQCRHDPSDTRTPYMILSISDDKKLFDSMRSQWLICYDSPTTSLVKYKIDFEFRNFLYKKVSSYFLDIVGENVFKAFERRTQVMQSNLEALADERKGEITGMETGVEMDDSIVLNRQSVVYTDVGNPRSFDSILLDPKLFIKHQSIKQTVKDLFLHEKIDENSYKIFIQRFQDSTGFREQVMNIHKLFCVGKHKDEDRFAFYLTDLLRNG